MDMKYRKINIKYATRCRECLVKIPAGVKAWGAVNEVTRKWQFLCDGCHALHVKPKEADPAAHSPTIPESDVDGDLRRAIEHATQWEKEIAEGRVKIDDAIMDLPEIPGMPGLDAKHETGDPDDPPVDKRPFLEKIKDTAPWRFA